MAVAWQQEPGEDPALDRERFLRMVTHELRAPIAAIAGYAELAQESPRPMRSTEVDESLQTIVRCADQLARLVEVVFDLLRLESGVLPEPVPVDCGDVLAEVVQGMRPLARERGVRLVARLSLDLPEVLGDAVRLSKLFTEILDNALQYTPSGGRVLLTCRPAAVRIITQVRDTGPGIPADELSRVGEPFYRGRAGLRSPTRRAGLGLALARAIVSAHGGQFTLQSQEGRGTVATIELPRA